MKLIKVIVVVALVLLVAGVVLGTGCARGPTGANRFQLGHTNELWTL